MLLGPLTRSRAPGEAARARQRPHRARACRPIFDPIKGQLDALLDPKTFVGRAPEQVDKFLADWVRPALADAELQTALGKAGKAELSV